LSPNLHKEDQKAGMKKPATASAVAGFFIAGSVLAKLEG